MTHGPTTVERPTQEFASWDFRPRRTHLPQVNPETEVVQTRPTIDDNHKHFLSHRQKSSGGQQFWHVKLNNAEGFLKGGHTKNNSLSYVNDDSNLKLGWFIAYNCSPVFISCDCLLVE